MSTTPNLLPPNSLCFIPASPWPLPAVPKECGPAEFSCQSGQCVALALHCDGDHDCQDGSDEEGCQPAPCQNHEYPCGLGDCLNASLVCNGRQDCADGSDEGGNCSVPCQRSCAHLCYPSPQGPRCWCGPGYQLSKDGLSCTDIDECTEWGEGTCSQTCLNAPGSYSCGCLPGYLLEPDGHVCKLTGKSWDGQAVLDLPTAAGSQGLPPHQALPLAKVSRLTAIDYAVKDKSLYFAEMGGNSIGLLRLKDWGRLSWKKAVAVEGTVTSLALDWLSGNLYWIGGQPPSIHVAAPRGRWALALLSERLQGAAWLALCPRASTMCFVTAAGSHGRNAIVECAAMDGTSRRVVWRKARAPTGLAFGGAGTRLYWADPGDLSICALQREVPSAVLSWMDPASGWCGKGCTVSRSLP
uniref:EGF-like domain-containing protein n=1 Tax=Malurus cyaneus samueli TaxID=2593467 RepID=A0A8C5TT15_9PASS